MNVAAVALTVSKTVRGRWSEGSDHKKIDYSSLKKLILRLLTTVDALAP